MEQTKECVCGENENESCDCGNCSCGQQDNVLIQIEYLISTLLTDEQKYELIHKNLCDQCGSSKNFDLQCNCYDG